MKYMGSKRAMLANQLGEILIRETSGAKRFADLFVGSGAVAWHVAENTPVEVIAADLQQFAVVLARAVISRNKAVDGEKLWSHWIDQAQQFLYDQPHYCEAEKLDCMDWTVNPITHVKCAQKLSYKSQQLPITKAYGGYYFSPKQAMQIDALRATLPLRENKRSLALASLISAASECAAAPGHTAQPFKPTSSGAKSLFGAWRLDIFSHTQSALKRLGPRYAQRCGRAVPKDALSLATRLTEDDIAFIDPPYSDVHYSRFYHVLETIAVGECSEVSGEGRYPPLEERPSSAFSIRSKSKTAVDTLLALLAERGVRTILTFPQEATSNGLSGTLIEEIGSQYFRVKKTIVNGRFSTLGGNLINRKAMIPAYEIILVMSPK